MDMTGRVLSHYRIIEKIGQGGMGAVYKAYDTRLEREVALKFLAANVTGEGEERERFRIEAKAAAALNHPNIATIFAIEEADDNLFIAMEHVEGSELKQLIDQNRLPSVSEALDYAVQICEGLQAAHERGIVHRDIKSSNIMVTGKGRVKVMDFGLASMRGGPQLTTAGTTVGTVAYMSPEQAKGETVDGRADIWSLGVVLYELLTGEVPFKGEHTPAVIYSIMNDLPPGVRTINPDIPPTLEAIVQKCLQRDLGSRYQSIGDVLTDLRTLTPSATASGVHPVSLVSSLKRPLVYIPAIIFIIAIGSAVAWWISERSREAWAREELLPQIEALSRNIRFTGEGPEPWKAFTLAEEAAKYIPDDPLLARLTPRFSRKLTILTSPPGVRVSAVLYSDTTDAWRFLGTTPIDSVRLPIGLMKIRMEKEGYRTGFDLAWNIGIVSDSLQYTLPAPGSIPDDMELVSASTSQFTIRGAPASLHMPGLEDLAIKHVGDFIMDRYEVTNKDFKRFVGAGGYKDRRFWKYPFVKDGRAISWDEAMGMFKDNTGQPGPSTWEAGSYPEGQEDFPVAGVSWYEAAAYSEFAGKSLPTIYHWDRVAFTWGSPFIVPFSNMVGGKGLEPVGHTRSMNRSGVFDLAGNVREWCFNETEKRGRFILGGGWNDPAYSFNDAYAQPPFDRSKTNGFRCIKDLSPREQQAELETPVKLPFRDFLREPKVPESTFALYRSQFDYDKKPLNAVIDTATETGEWIRQKVSFDAAYGTERMSAYLFLPKNAKPPFQTVIYFPGSGAIHTRSSEGIIPQDYYLKSGRAFLFPIYKSTFERGDDLSSDYATETNFWKDHVIMWGQDLRRSVDYLESRKDIDAEKLAYCGASWGSAMAPMMLAVEPRIKAAVLIVAGLEFQKALPQVDEVNYISRVTIPVIMLNGKYDFFFPYQTSQVPFFEMLGTPKEKKKLFVYDGGHSVPRTEMIKESLAWLDQYLGPVEESANH